MAQTYAAADEPEVAEVSGPVVHRIRRTVA
jgi:hypothetical protein